MPRPSRFTTDDVLDAALAAVARSGPDVAMAEVAVQLSGPVGSIYHRFESRNDLLVRLWLRSVRRFQAGLFRIVDRDSRAGRPVDTTLVALARQVPAYCRHHPDEAMALTLFRQQRLIEECPETLRPEIESLNDRVDALARTLTRARYGSATRRRLGLVELATRVTPYGLVRPYLGRPVPRVLDDAAGAAARAILALGDPQR
jgi:AcrR family transcriptional regulator